MLTKRYFIPALLLLAMVPAQAQDEAIQSSIQASYDRACLAMHYKYIDGILGIRTHPYHATMANGSEISEATEVKTLEKVLAQATSVTETSSIVQMVQVNDHQVKCRVKDVLEMHQAQAGAKSRPPLVIRTVTDDTWVKVGNGWKLSATVVREQNSDNQ